MRPLHRHPGWLRHGARPCATSLPTTRLLAVRSPAVHLLAIFGTLLTGTPAQAAPRVALDLTCVSLGAGPELNCLARIAGADGRPLAGATVTLTASMPSMPMAHHVEPATAAPTATAGEYRARLRLEMPGAWSVQTDVRADGGVRDRIVRTLQVDACAGDRRCPVAGKAPAPAASHHHP